MDRADDIEDLQSDGSTLENLKDDQIDALRLYVQRCRAWNAERMNLLSISLLLICGSLDSVAKLWVNFLCLNFGQLENLSSIVFGLVIFCLSLPLFLDTSFLLLQRVHPKEVSLLV